MNEPRHPNQKNYNEDQYAKEMEKYKAERKKWLKACKKSDALVQLVDESLKRIKERRETHKAAVKSHKSMEKENTIQKGIDDFGSK